MIDRATNTVYRIDPKTRKPAAILKNGQTIRDAKAAAPQDARGRRSGSADPRREERPLALAAGRRQGRGHPGAVNVSGSSRWGSDIKSFGTYVRSAEQGLYNLYVVDPSEKQILRYSPAADGSGYPAAPSGFLATAQAVDDVEGMFIDGDVYVAAGGKLVRFAGGQAGGWEADEPGDELLREAPEYVDVTSPGDRGQGLLYAYDKANSRVVVLRQGVTATSASSSGSR